MHGLQLRTLCLQVEHGITELVTGTDLVEMMLRLQLPVAAVEATGESPACRASTPDEFKAELKGFQLKMTGWAIEGRLVAEDPCHNLMPSWCAASRSRCAASLSCPAWVDLGRFVSWLERP